MLKRGGLVFAFLLAVALAWPSSPAGAQPPPLPPEAQTAFERGMAATQQQDWALAIRYFAEAQGAAPTYPPILFNLGLAHAKAGHNATAMIWLAAYLKAAPSVHNVAAVRGEVTRLDVDAERKIRGIMHEALVAARRIRDAGGSELSLMRLPSEFASVGDIDGALNTRLEMSVFRGPEAELWFSYATRLVKEGREVEAKKIVRSWADTKWESVWRGIEDLTGGMEGVDRKVPRNLDGLIRDANLTWETEGRLVGRLKEAAHQKHLDDTVTQLVGIAKNLDYYLVEARNIWRINYGR